MKKEKIAISITKDMLKRIDSRIDGSAVRSRSQAIEFFLKKGLETRIVDTAVVLLSKRHHKTALTKFKRSCLLREQMDFFRKNGIENIIIIAQNGDFTNQLKNECVGFATVFVTEAKTNGDALYEIKNMIKNDFIVLGGDIYINFDLNGMIKKHIASGRTATIGLMSRGMPSKYGTAIMDGDYVVNFEEKPKRPSSFIVNSGIYIFHTDIFESTHGSIEENTLPKLASSGQLVGFFTNGEYVHFDEV
jgi:NDP-sugar pyrophosphorylase family protein